MRWMILVTDYHARLTNSIFLQYVNSCDLPSMVMALDSCTSQLDVFQRLVDLFPDCLQLPGQEN